MIKNLINIGTPEKAGCTPKTGESDSITGKERFRPANQSNTRIKIFEKNRNNRKSVKQETGVSFTGCDQHASFYFFFTIGTHICI